MKKIFLALALLFAVVSYAQAPFTEDFGSINSPEPVNAFLWRSGRPTLSNYRMFVQQGIRVVINLEDNTRAIQQDAALAKSAGMVFYSFPMDATKTPSDQTMRQILSLLKDPRAKTLVHCHHGQDRTGLVIGLERVFVENWTPQAAYQEMLKKGFHPQLKALDNYFKNQTKSRWR